MLRFLPISGLDVAHPRDPHRRAARLFATGQCMHGGMNIALRPMENPESKSEHRSLRGEKWLLANEYGAPGKSRERGTEEKPTRLTSLMGYFFWLAEFRSRAVNLFHEA